MVSELTVILKDDEKILRTKYLMYDVYSIDENDPKIKECIDASIKQFVGTPDSVQVKINLEIQ